MIQQIIDNLKKGFPEYEFQIDIQTTKYTRAFIHHNSVSLGRLNFVNGELDHSKFYKPSDYEYEKRDDFFYLYPLWLKTGIRPDISNLIGLAKLRRARKIASIKENRQANPKHDKYGSLKSRPKISENWMGEFRKLVNEEIQIVLKGT